MIGSAYPYPRAAPDGMDKLWAVFLRDFRMAVSYGTNFWLSWISVAVDIGIAYFLGSLIAPSTRFGFDGNVHSYFDYLVINTAFLRFQSVAVTAFALAIRDGQTMGTLEVLLSTPSSIPFIVLSSGMYAFVYQLAQTFVYIGIAMLFGLNVSHANLLTLGVFIALMIAAVTPIGVIASSAAMALKKTGPIEFFLTSITQLFGGVYLPVAMLPLGLREVGNLLPVTHALNGLRAALQGATVAQMWPDILWLCGLSAVFIPVSLFVFSAALNRAKVDGTLGLY
ncbi:MAG: ABC transporter permease [Candidatus Eremiobacteraeota bacterium]|nr:ABC transporter permease [Candidatus Eremiobacteraeota bacterium]MBV8354288.1 ABC transporter permease [Candidatus Eremiobacteraeota bacterium]